MRFALSARPNPDAAAISRSVEAAGFRSFWLYDAHRVWMDPYPLLGQVACATRHIHFGLCVTNPVTRAPEVTGLLTATLHAVSGGRAELGLGRGDASVRALGRAPSSLVELRQAVDRFRAEAKAAEASWGASAEIPVWIGTYGPRGLALAGSIADGVILQFADPDLVQWAKAYIHEGARDAGRDPREVRLMCAAPLAVECPPEEALHRTRWFARMIAPDVAGLIVRHADAFPSALVDWARDWSAAEAASRPAVADGMSHRLALVGSTEACRERLARLADLGVEEMNVFTLGEEHAAIDAVGRTFL